MEGGACVEGVGGREGDGVCTWLARGKRERKEENKTRLIPLCDYRLTELQAKNTFGFLGANLGCSDDGQPPRF